MRYTMYDSVTVGNIGRESKMVAGYLDGRYANIPQLQKRCNNAVIVTITVTPIGDDKAHVYDCEKGNGKPKDAAIWAERNTRNKHEHKTIYCSRSVKPTIVRELQRLKMSRSQMRRVHWWIADWTGHAHIVLGSVATQWTNDTGGCDLSRVKSNWPGVFSPLAPRRRVAARLVLRGLSRRKQEQIAPKDRHLLMNLAIQSHRVVMLDE